MKFDGGIHRVEENYLSHWIRNAVNQIREALKKIGKFQENFLNKKGGPGFLNFMCFLVTIFVLKTSKNAMQQMILSFKMKGDDISDHFLMLWFQKYFLDTVGFTTYGGGSSVLNQKVTL